MSEWVDLAKQVVPAFLTGVLGVAGTWVAAKRKEITDMGRLRKENKELRSQVTTALDGVDSADTALGERIDTVADRVKDLVEDFGRQIKELDNAIRQRGVEHRGQRAQIAALTTELTGLRTSLTALRDQVEKLDDASVRGMKENQELWQEINRSIGRIEGTLHAIQRRGSNGGFPSPTTPR